MLAALIFLTVGPWPGRVHHRSDPVQIEGAEARRLIFPAGDSGTMRFVRGWRLDSPHSHFGGFSAMAVTAGDDFLLLSDHGHWVRFTLRGDAGLRNFRLRPLVTPDGSSKSKSHTDVEAVAIDPGTGQVWLALEGINQIWRLNPALTRIESRAGLPDPQWPGNGGAEAMVRLSDQRTIIFSENAADDPRGRQGLLVHGDPAVAGTRAQRFFYDAQGKGLVSDAALLPDGRILLVHRRLGLNPVFTTEIALVDPDDIRPGGVLHSHSIGTVPAPLADNFEGAAIVAEDGRTYLWLVSDDNFNIWQRSLLLQFELVDLPRRGGHNLPS